MKTRDAYFQFFTSFIFLFLSIVSVAQVDITERNTITERAAAVMALAGEGVDISNIVFNCPNQAFGDFVGVGTDLELDAGIVMSSGECNMLEGPNSAGGTTGVTGGVNDEDDLEDLSGKSVRDVCVLKFDVTPAGDTLTFNYVFGSEEYHEYVCSNFNDVFGFFISGPGINGSYEDNGINISLIPGTSDPVSIGTVNNGNPWGSNCSGGGVSCPCNSTFIIDNTDGTDLEFDGFTKVLTATAPVIPCETYTLKLAIADATDSVLDSGVFIEAGSLESKTIDLSSSTGYVDNLSGTEVAVEDCVNGIIEFDINFDVLQTTSIYFDILGTAENGVDYQWLEDSVVVNPGDTSAVIEIIPFEDNTLEGIETVTIALTGISSCLSVLSASIDVSLVDNPYINIIPEFPLQICKGNSTNFVSVSGGLEYNWFIASTESPDPVNITDYLDDPTSNNPLLFPDYTTLFGCDASVGPCHDTVYIEILIDQEPIITTDYVVCVGSSVQLDANDVDGQVTGVSWSPADNLSCSDCLQPTFMSDTPQSITATLTYSQGCTHDVVVDVAVDDVPFLSMASTALEKCIESDIQVEVLGGVDGTYEWSPNIGLSCTDCPNPTITGLTENTTYNVVARNINDCTDEISFTIDNLTHSIDVGADVEDCEELSVTIGPDPIAGYTYEWSPTDGLSDPNIAQPQVDLTLINNQETEVIYTLTAYDTNNCIASDDMTAIVVPGPTVTAGEDQEVLIGGIATIVASSPDPEVSFAWNPIETITGSTSAAATSVIPSETTVYHVTVTSPLGCTATDSLTVEVIDRATLLLPTAFTPNGDGMNDILAVFSNQVEELIEFKIFNRWGNTLYVNPGDLNDGWDGFFNGNPQEIGVYVYQIRYKEVGVDTEKFVKGNVTLVR